MLRRHVSLLVAIALIMLVVTACVVRTGPSRGRSYRSAPSENHKHKKWEQKKPKKHKKHR